MATKKNNRNLLGLALILVGVFMLLGKIGLITENFTLYILGAGFIVVYLFIGGTSNYGSLGFLIPGTVLIAIGAFADLENSGLIGNIGAGAFFWFLSLAFFIVLLHTRSFPERSWGDRHWPIFPAGGLLFFGGFVYFAENYQAVMEKLEVLNIIFPIVIIAVGLFIFVRGRGEQESGEEKENG